jgi:hypothetical protein
MRMDATSLENACRLSIEAHGAGPVALRAQDARPAVPKHLSHLCPFAPAHAALACCSALEGAAPELFAGVRSTVFRSWDKPTIVSDFVLRWALAHSLAQMRTYRHRHVSTGDADQQAQLQALAAEFGALDFFCINDTTDDAHLDDPRLRQVQSVLQAMLPQASGFEQSAGQR